MDRTLSSQEGKEALVLQSLHYGFLKHPSFSSRKPKPFSQLRFWASKSLRKVSGRPTKMSNGFGGSQRFDFKDVLVSNSVYCASPCSSVEKLDSFPEKTEAMEDENRGFCDNVAAVTEGVSRESGASSAFLASEITGNDEQSSTEDSSSPSSMVWPIEKDEPPHCALSNEAEDVEKPHSDRRKLEKKGSSLSEVEMMKERFAKLLLGEDKSGCGNGVSTALAVSNAITNLCATIFGQIWRLEPLPIEKKVMWRREMEWLLSVSDHIVELMPSLQTFPDGSTLEIMTSRPRSDLFVNLPALRKLDNMLLETLDCFENTDFWYVDQGIMALEENGPASFRKPLPRREEKWWLPVPRVPPGGLRENARKLLQHRRKCAGQILKAALAINSIALADMQVPYSFLGALPKNAKASLGDIIYRYINSDQFSPECLLDCLDLSSEHQALEIANRVESSIYVWHRKASSKHLNSTHRSSSWEIVKDLVTDVDKRELLAERAETLLLCLKHRFPGLSQTALDTSKIQYNKDVGKAILESYSRALESLAFNIVPRIDDLFYVDDLAKHLDQPLSISKVGTIAHLRTAMMVQPASSTPYRTAFVTPSFSPLMRPSASNVGRSPVPENTLLHRGVGVKKVLTDYPSIDGKKNELISNLSIRSDSSTSTNRGSSGTQYVGSYEMCREATCPSTQNSPGKDLKKRLTTCLYGNVFACCYNVHLIVLLIIQKCECLGCINDCRHLCIELSQTYCNFVLYLLMYRKIRLVFGCNFSVRSRNSKQFL